jgi:hypothetical protein
MDKKEKDIEFIDQKTEQNDIKKLSIKEYLNGSIIAKQFVGKQLVFVIFCFILAITYIANRFHAEYILRKTINLENEMNELRSESITTSSELMFSSRQSQVYKMVSEAGLELKESVVPPTKIKMRD